MVCLTGLNFLVRYTLVQISNTEQFIRSSTIFIIFHYSAWDSGAPFMIAGENPEDDLLVALGSSGVSCADKVFPATQARVSSGIGWIREQVCTLSVDPPLDFQCEEWLASVAKNATATPKPMTGKLGAAPQIALMVSGGGPDLFPTRSCFAFLTVVAFGAFAVLALVRRTLHRQTHDIAKEEQAKKLKDENHKQQLSYGSTEC
jgi:hypothetical protein